MFNINGTYALILSNINDIEFDEYHHIQTRCNMLLQYFKLHYKHYAVYFNSIKIIIYNLGSSVLLKKVCY